MRLKITIPVRWETVVDGLKSYREWAPNLMCIALVTLIAAEVLLAFRPLQSQSTAGATARGIRAAAAVPAAVDISAILAANVFGADNSPVPAPAALAERLKLTGTLSVEKSPEQGYALFGSTDGRARLVAAGGQVEDGMILVNVFADHVLLNDHGTIETLILPRTGAGGGHEYHVRMPAVEQPSQIDALTKEAAGYGKPYSRLFTITQATGETRFNGIVVGPGSDSAAFANIGLHPGDTIISINGIRVSTPEVLTELDAPGAIKLGVEGPQGYHIITVDSAQLR